MYLALATIPTLIGLVPYAGATVFGYDVPPAFGLGFAATFGLALTAKIMEYTNLQNAEILVGQCPCCEAEIKQFFGGAEPADTVAYKCGVCGTECNLDPQGAAHHRSGAGSSRCKVRFNVGGRAFEGRRDARRRVMTTRSARRSKTRREKASETESIGRERRESASRGVAGCVCG